MQLRSCGIHLFIFGLGLNLISNVSAESNQQIAEEKTKPAILAEQGPIVEEVVTDLKTGEKIEVKENPPDEKKALVVTEKPKEVLPPSNKNPVVPVSETKKSQRKHSFLPSDPVAESNPKEIASTKEKTKETDEQIIPSGQSSIPIFVGHIVLLNQEKNFVVIDFERGMVPPVRSELGVYRNDIFVGSVRITDPVKPPMASADILTGVLRQGDVVR